MTLLAALQNKNLGRAPVWIMRQAGRYLPEYRKLREKHSLEELFFTKDLIVEVTKMPLARFSLDAAIVFSDITVIAEVLGLSLVFQEGPKVTPNVTPTSSFTFIPEKCLPIFEAISQLKEELKVPLLGFCGAPFTAASYLIGDLDKTVLWMRQDPVSFKTLLDTILQVSIWYLQMQEKRGVDAVQIFDSWANVLTAEEHQQYCLSYVEKLVHAVEVPSLFFMREVSPYISQVPCGVSVDWTISMKEARSKTQKPLQGNLDPRILFEPLSTIEKKTDEILSEMKGDPGFILNLGHGILPNTPLEAVHCFIDTARNF